MNYNERYVHLKYTGGGRNKNFLIEHFTEIIHLQLGLMYPICLSASMYTISLNAELVTTTPWPINYKTNVIYLNILIILNSRNVFIGVCRTLMSSVCPFYANPKFVNNFGEFADNIIL